MHPRKTRKKSTQIPSKLKNIHMVLPHPRTLKLLLAISILKLAKSRSIMELTVCTAFTKSPVRMVSQE
jgi:hypothetical protein